MEEVEAAAIASGFSKNTTLREITFVNLYETRLSLVRTALQMHPLLEKLHVVGYASLAGMDALLLIIDKFTGEHIVGFESFMQEMGRNTTILKIAITGVRLRRENIQQLTAMLRRNKALENLNLRQVALGRREGLAEINSLCSIPKHLYSRWCRFFTQWFG